MYIISSNVLAGQLLKAKQDEICACVSFCYLCSCLLIWGRYLCHATLLASVQQIGYIVKWQVYILSEEDRLLYNICRYDHTKTLYKIYSFLRDFSKISAITQVGTGWGFADFWGSEKIFRPAAAKKDVLLRCCWVNIFPYFTHEHTISIHCNIWKGVFRCRRFILWCGSFLFIYAVSQFQKRKKNRFNNK